MNDSLAAPDRPGTIAHIQYGKADVSFYRTYAKPLAGLTPIPESAFTGRPNTLFAYDVEAPLNLKKTLGRLERLLDRFAFGPMWEALDAVEANAPAEARVGAACAPSS